MVRVALGQDQIVVGVKIWTLFQTITIVYAVNWIVEIKVGVVLGRAIHITANHLISCHASENLRGVPICVGVDCAIYHTTDAQEEQQTAEDVSAFSIVFVKGS